MTIYKITTSWGDTVYFAADLTNAAAAIYHVDDASLEIAESIGYQTADARHDSDAAAELVIRSMGRDWYAAPGDDRDDDEIIADAIETVEEMVSPERQDLIDEIQSLDLVAPDQVEYIVLTAYDRDGMQAARQQLQACIDSDAREHVRFGIA